MSRLVVAIGGNALSSDAAAQEKELRGVASALREILISGNEIILVHGNGPQVGVIHRAFERAHHAGTAPELAFYECTAMNEGAIGFHLEQAIEAELADTGRSDIHVSTIITRVTVDPKDPAFANPQKPVGAFYTEEQAKDLMQRTGKKYAQDSNRGWRLVVPSPDPQHILEASAIRELAQAGEVVIGGGGAGIPVVPTDSGGYVGIEAVCDKDLTASRLAQLIDADLLFLFTAVDRVCINFGKPDQVSLSALTPPEADRYIAQGQFAPGSMLPKVRACVDFVRGRPERTAVIAHLNKAAYALAGETGTIVKDQIFGGGFAPDESR